MRLHVSNGEDCIGCTCRHSLMELSEFINHFFSVLSEKIYKDKMVVLLEDFNANLLKYDHDKEIADS